MATAMPRAPDASHQTTPATATAVAKTPPSKGLRLLAPLLALLASVGPAVHAAAAALPGYQRFRDGREAESNLISGIVLFGVGLIITIIITVVVLQFYPLLTSEVNTAQTDANSTTSATNSLDLLPLILVIGLVFLGLGTMFAGLSMIVKATRSVG